MDFSHKIVLLTGATGGIGAGLAHTLSQQAAHLLVSSRSDADLKRLVRELPQAAKVTPIVAALAGGDLVCLQPGLHHVSLEGHPRAV